MKKRKFLITGGIVTTMLLSNSHSAKAAHIPAPTYQSRDSLKGDFLSFGNDVKETLVEQGFSSSQISKILKKR